MEKINESDCQQHIKVLVRSAKQRDRRISMTKYSKIDIPAEVFFQYVTNKCELPSIEWRSLSFSTELEQLLISYEQKTLQSIKFKFGVLYRKKGQKLEEHFYGNDTSPEYEAFLSCLGDKMELLNWSKWAGGLDTKSKSTGTVGWYASFHQSYEVMFHSAPHLPKTAGDPQQLEKKRHVGNDLVVFLFDESNEPFSPQQMSSKVTHVYIVVRPVDATSYTVAVVNRSGVATYGPPIPQKLLKQEVQLTRNWLLTKAVNGERSSFHSTLFKQRLAKTRGSILNDVLEKLVK